MSQVPLTPRALAFLATLERRPAVSTSQVEQALANQGLPCFAPWLEFHERYAGFLERFGKDGAIWGLIHTKPLWLAPGKADVEKEEHEDVWYIRCADAHPSYSYQLDSAGEFLGTPAQSFDIHVERIALGWDFAQAGESHRLTVAEMRDISSEPFLQQLQAHRIYEASDKYSIYYMSDRILAVEDAKKRILRSVRSR